MESLSISVGDKISITTPVHRVWWQFWKPRIVRWEMRSYVVREVTHV